MNILPSFLLTSRVIQCRVLNKQGIIITVAVMPNRCEFFKYTFGGSDGDSKLLFL